MKAAPFLVLLICTFSCKTPDKLPTLGSIERTSAGIDEIVDKEAIPEILSDGYIWSEGPLWVASQRMLLFSDVPANTVYRWTEADSIEVFLKPSGYTGSAPSNSREEGSNGLALDRDGRLILCQHGNRQLAAMEATLTSPEPVFAPLADRYNGKRFNSPNDVVVRSNGDYFFTDPPYGMPRDTAQEIPFQGVYKVSGNQVTLLVDSITRPNGIAFMPGEKTLIIANSDPKKAIWYAYDLDDNDALTNGRIFYDATPLTKTEKGLPDGLKIDRSGNVFASGPGGIWIFNKNGDVLGKIKTPVPAANCAFSPDEKTLYITADNYLLRLRMRN